MTTVLVLMAAVALLHTVVQFYGRLVRLGIGKTIKLLGRVRVDRPGEFD